MDGVQDACKPMLDSYMDNPRRNKHCLGLSGHDFTHFFGMAITHTNPTKDLGICDAGNRKHGLYFHIHSHSIPLHTQKTRPFKLGYVPNPTLVHARGVNICVLQRFDGYKTADSPLVPLAQLQSRGHSPSHAIRCNSSRPRKQPEFYPPRQRRHEQAPPREHHVSPCRPEFSLVTSL